MPRYAAFLRAVNVGGRFVKMADLRALLAEAGHGDVQTYIQSGNVVLTSRIRSPAEVEAELERIFVGSLSFTVDTMVRTPAQLAEAIEAGDALADPFDGAGRHMVSVLKSAPDPSAQAALDEWSRTREPGLRCYQLGRELHLFYAMPLTESKLTGPKLAKICGCPGTVREWRVLQAVQKLL